MGYGQNYFKPETESVKILARICQILKTKQWPSDWKCSTPLPIFKKGNAKEQQREDHRSYFPPKQRDA